MATAMALVYRWRNGFCVQPPIPLNRACRDHRHGVRLWLHSQLSNELNGVYNESSMHPIRHPQVNMDVECAFVRDVLQASRRCCLSRAQLLLQQPPPLSWGHSRGAARASLAAATCSRPL